MKTDYEELAHQVNDPRIPKNMGSPDMKFVSFEHGGTEFSVVFPKQVVHSLLAEAVEQSGAKVVSAGFCRFMNGSKEVEVWGVSTSLREAKKPHVCREDKDPLLIYTSYTVGYWTYMWPMMEDQDD